jgi:hypothetical protein
MLPIERNAQGRAENHPTRIYRMMRRWHADGCVDRVFSGTVHLLHKDPLLDLSVIHSDGTTTAAKKGADNLGYSQHKHLKGDKVGAFFDRECNIIARCPATLWVTGSFKRKRIYPSPKPVTTR